MTKTYIKQPIKLITNYDNITSISNSLPNYSSDDLNLYYRSGRYLLEAKSIANSAAEYALKTLKQSNQYKLKSQKLAAIFDIDETMLSNADILAKHQFINSPDVWAYSNGISSLPEIKPVKALYDFLVSHGISIFIVTAREASSLEITKTNLSNRGYYHYQALYLKPDHCNQSFSDYKSKIRADIIDQGYQIILNIGDKLTDFEGGHFDHGFLLPNHFY